MFLRAAAKILREFPDAHFVLAGEGELKNRIGKSGERNKNRKKRPFYRAMRKNSRIAFGFLRLRFDFV